VKVFSDRPASSKRVEFDLDFWDGPRSERHHFGAFPAIDALALAQVNKLAANARTTMDAIIKVKDSIRSLLDDTDGTPMNWEPEALPREAQLPRMDLSTWPAESESEPLPEGYSVVGALDDNDPEPEQQFLAPDGTVHPMRDANKYLDPANGSSRRRWVELMDGDNDLTVEYNTIMKLWQWLVSEAAERPTVR
jgi:hypothetical protein